MPRFSLARRAPWLLAALLCACSPKGAPAPATKAADAGASPASAAAPALRTDGSPQITDSADGVHIEFHVYGSGEPAIVLVHGWACDDNYWNAQLQALQTHYRVVTLDLGGFGASGRNRSDWSIENFGEDVAAVVRRIPNRHVILVGHSMGGPVVLAAAHLIGERVIGIIGVDTLKSIGEPPLSERQIGERVQPFRSNFIAAIHDFVPQHLFAKNADPAFVNKVAYGMSLASPKVAVPALEALYRFDFATVLPGIRVPIVAINSDLGGPTDEKRIQKLAPTFRAVVIPGTGHFLMLEAPQKFNPVLLREIDAIVKGAAG